MLEILLSEAAEALTLKLQDEDQRSINMKTRMDL